LKTLFGIFALLTSSLAFAVPVTEPHDIDGTNSVEYTFFTVTNTGLFDISAVRSSGRIDPQLYLFRDDGDLDNRDFIAQNDDGGAGLNSLIESINLGVGTYVAAVSDYRFTRNEAIRGFNRRVTPGTITVTIDGAAYGADGGSAVNTVPAPNALALLGIGLIAAGVVSRRRKKT